LATRKTHMRLLCSFGLLHPCLSNHESALKTIGVNNEN
jgi:hypothetical protein